MIKMNVNDIKNVEYIYEVCCDEVVDEKELELLYLYESDIEYEKELIEVLEIEDMMGCDYVFRDDSDRLVFIDRNCGYVGRSKVGVEVEELVIGMLKK